MYQLNFSAAVGEYVLIEESLSKNIFEIVKLTLVMEKGKKLQDFADLELVYTNNPGLEYNLGVIRANVPIKGLIKLTPSPEIQKEISAKKKI